MNYRQALGGGGVARGGSLARASAVSGAAPGASGAGKKKKYNPYAVLSSLESGDLLSGKDLTRAARALTALEIRPQVRGYKQLASQLRSEREMEAKGLGALGTRLQGGVTDVYKNIASAEAQGLANQQALGQGLVTQSGAIAQTGAQDLRAMQGGEVGDYTKALALRGAPGGGSAQQDLANAVAAQQANQSANSQAAQQAAASQATGYSQLASGLAGSAQLQGGAAVAGIGRDILSRTAESNQKYGEGIQTALGKAGDARALKGSTFIKNLLELRGGEQKYQLGRAAVRGERQANQLGKEQLAEDKRQANMSNQLGLASLALKEWEAAHPGAASGERRERKQKAKQEIREVRSLIPGLVATYGAPENKKMLNQFTLALNGKASADPTLVQRVLNRWYKKRSLKEAVKNAKPHF